jgi:hypothetical protein
MAGSDEPQGDEVVGGGHRIAGLPIDPSR